MMTHDGNDHVKLPKDLLMEIFVRSSVESLLRAKCVCKKWYDLIENPNFIQNHLWYQKDHDKVRLLLQYYNDDTQQLSYALLDNESLESNTYHVVDNLQLNLYHMNLEGPIDGLYCLFNGRDRVVLWNPSLLEFKILPLPHPHFFPHIKVYEGYTGFGIDISANNYKLVLVRTLDRELEFYRRGYITVYNLTTNTWKLLHLVDHYLLEYQFYESHNISFFNGSCHWWTDFGMVIAFDMAEETFRRILGPELSHSDYTTAFLTIHYDKVALLFHCECSVDVWLMLEEGVWTNQLSITSLPPIYREVVLWKNDGLLVSIDGWETPDTNRIFKLVLCHANSQESRVVGPKGMPSCFRASVYHESLVPVHYGTKYKQKRTSLNTISDFFMPYSNPYLEIMPKDEFS